MPLTLYLSAPIKDSGGVDGWRRVVNVENNDENIGGDGAAFNQLDQIH